MTEKDQKAAEQAKPKTKQKGRKNIKITSNMVKDFVILTKTNIDLSNWSLKHWNPKTRKLTISCKTTSVPENESLDTVLTFFGLTLDDVQETFYEGSWDYKVIF